MITTTVVLLGLIFALAVLQFCSYYGFRKSIDELHDICYKCEVNTWTIMKWYDAVMNGDKTKSKPININIDKLIETCKIDTVKGDEAKRKTEITKIIVDALTQAINDAQLTK